MSAPVPLEKSCSECKRSAIYLVSCNRCADGHGDFEKLCEACIFPDEYYGDVCSECYGYLLENVP